VLRGVFELVLVRGVNVYPVTGHCAFSVGIGSIRQRHYTRAGGADSIDLAKRTRLPNSQCSHSSTGPARTTVHDIRVIIA